jgi:hypothetical protein
MEGVSGAGQIKFGVDLTLPVVWDCAVTGGNRAGPMYCPAGVCSRCLCIHAYVCVHAKVIMRVRMHCMCSTASQHPERVQT